jgi:hypothetical protein
MVKRRAEAAGVVNKLGCRFWRAGGIMAKQENDGSLERARQVAAHALARAIDLYDRRGGQVSLDQIECVRSQQGSRNGR